MRARNLAPLIATVAVAACNWFGETGGIIFAANEWDEDVIIRTEAVHSSWKLVPAGTKADLVIGYGRPRPGDRVVVFDRSCGLLATFPITGELHSLRLGPDGAAQFTGERFLDTGPEVTHVPPYEPWSDREGWCVEELEQAFPTEAAS